MSVVPAPAGTTPAGATAFEVASTGPVRWATRLSLAAVLLAVLVSLAVPGWSGAGGRVLAGGLVLGLPHGAVDHLLPAYRGRSRRVLPVFLVAYAGTAALAWGLLTLVPGWGLAAFVALSVVHFGAGERAFTTVREPGAPAWATGVLLGATPVLVPLFLHRASVAPYLAALVPGWDGRLPAAAALVAAALLVLDAVAGLRAWRTGRRLIAVEVVALAVLAAVAPPAVAVGVYFGAWHSVRHLALLLAEDPANEHALRTGHLARPLARLATSAALPTAAAAAFVVALWLWSADRDLHRFVAADVTVLAALTVPHALVVGWLDRTRGCRSTAIRCYTR